MQRIFTSDADKNIPIRLTPKELEKPVIVLINFFRTYNLIEVRKLLEDWMIKACSEQDNSVHGYKEKSSIMFLRYQLEALIEAIYVIFQEPQSKKKAKDEYNSAQETLHLTSSKANRKRLEEAVGEMKKGKSAKHNLIKK